MATVNLTASFFSQTADGVVFPDWTNNGTDILATLSASFPTETATMRATHVFATPVVINSIFSTLTGVVSAGGATSTYVYFNGTAYGPYGSTVGPQSNFSPAYSLVGGTLTVDITLRGDVYVGSPATLRLYNQTVTVDYTELPTIHNLGINF